MSVDSLYTQHERRFEANRFVYPVLSRRSGGMSVGINLNPDKVCNFDCAYCQVNRVEAGETRFVDMPRLLAELEDVLRIVVSGRLFATGKFRHTPLAQRQLKDIAFSGDGEPTTSKNFDEIVDACSAVKRRFGLSHVKMVLISNASMFHRPHIQRALDILDENEGEIWAKLDAGTADYFQLVNRAPFGFAHILKNITEVARRRPIVIQSLFMRVHGEGPPVSEQDDYCQRLREIVTAGGDLKLIQLYTLARQPAEDFVTPLSDSEIDEMVARVRSQTGLTVAGYYGSSPT